MTQKKFNLIAAACENMGIGFKGSLPWRLNAVSSISLPAMGRVARIGELYDARTDQFSRISLVNDNISSLIQSTQNRYSNLKYLKLNTFTEKLQSLDVQAGFKLSVLCGLVEVSGSGKFVRDKQQSTKSAKVSVANFMTTEFEQIDIAGVDGRKLIDLDILTKIDATHVVVGIQWGGNVIVSVEDCNTENKDKETVVGSLTGKLQMLVASISINGSVDISAEEKKQLSQFNFELYGDVLPEEVPTSLVDAIVLMKSVPKLLMDGNNGRGKALSYTLLPIALFRDLLNVEIKINSMVAQLDESIINSCVKLFEDLSNVELKLNDLLTDLNNFKNFMSKDKIDKIILLASNFQIYESKLKRRLSELLILVKSGKENINQLTIAVDDAYSNDLSPNKIDFSQFFLIQQEFRFVKLLTDLKVYVLDKTTSFNEFMSMNLNKNIYSLFYSTEFPNISDEPMIAFRQFSNLGDKFDPTGIFVAIKADVLGDDEHKTYFNFEAPNRLRLYKNGILIIDEYTLSTSSNNMPKNPELWSLYYMQTQITQLMPQLTEMKNNPVPINYIYVQYPDMPKPTELWPSVQWYEITTQYKGLLFRVSGDCPSSGYIKDETDMVKQVDNSIEGLKRTPINELKYFNQQTTKIADSTKKNALIMGRKTYFGIPENKRPLPGRMNIVLSTTSNPADYPNEVLLCKSFNDAIDKLSEPSLAEQIENVWIVGGYSVYKEAMESPLCHRIYFTEVKAEFECDAFFPTIPDSFRMVPNDCDLPSDVQEENGIKYQYKIYERL